VNSLLSTETTSRPGDPPLSSLGLEQARHTGVFLDKLLARKGLSAENLTWMSSPFLRCLQTSNAAIDAMENLDRQKIAILPEYSVFEWDGHNGEWHKSLPELSERKHYFSYHEFPNHPLNFTPGVAKSFRVSTLATLSWPIQP
jgi:broad specificity phosphatase PhoE